MSITIPKNLQKIQNWHLSLIWILRVVSRTAAKLKQQHYLEIVVRFNRDIPTLVASSRVPEHTQLDT